MVDIKPASLKVANAADTTPKIPVICVGNALVNDEKIWGKFETIAFTREIPPSTTTGISAGIILDIVSHITGVNDEMTSLIFGAIFFMASVILGIIALIRGIKFLSKNTTGNIRRQIIKIVFVIYITDKDLMSLTYSDHLSFEEKKTNHLVENE